MKNKNKDDVEKLKSKLDDPLTNADYRRYLLDTSTVGRQLGNYIKMNQIQDSINHLLNSNLDNVDGYHDITKSLMFTPDDIYKAINPYRPVPQRDKVELKNNLNKLLSEYKHYFLEVADTNMNALKLYEKLGFKEVYRKKVMPGSGINYLIYMKYSKE